MTKDITHLNTALDWCRENGELLETNVEIDPALQLAGMQKVLDNGPAARARHVRALRLA